MYRSAYKGEKKQDKNGHDYAPYYLFTWNEKGERICIEREFEPEVSFETSCASLEKLREFVSTVASPGVADKVYIDSKRSLFGTILYRAPRSLITSELKRIEKYDSKSFIKSIVEGGRKKYQLYDNFKEVNLFIMSELEGQHNKPDFMKHDLKVAFFDIETKGLPGNKFPEPHLAEAEISLITVYINSLNQYFTYGTREFTGDLPDNIKSTYILCKSERELLEKFLNLLKTERPDIVTGWNTNFFDMPYVVNRIIKHWLPRDEEGNFTEEAHRNKEVVRIEGLIAGGIAKVKGEPIPNTLPAENDKLAVAEARAKKPKNPKQKHEWPIYRIDAAIEKEGLKQPLRSLEPHDKGFTYIPRCLLELSEIGEFDIFVQKTKDSSPRYYLEYSPKGMAFIDYIDIYKKFKVKIQESYKLDHIGLIEVGEKKKEYTGSIAEFQEQDWNNFVLYNIQDVKLLVDIDKKTNYLKVYRQLASKGLTMFKDALGVSNYSMGACSMIAHTRGQRLYTPVKNEISADEITKNEGGYVSARVGSVRDMFTLDFSSLYPNIVITNNISPDTLVATVRQDVATGLLEVTSLEDGKKSMTTPADFNNLIRNLNLIYVDTSSELVYKESDATGVVYKQTDDNGKRFQGIYPEYMATTFAERKAARKRLFKEEEILGYVGKRINKLGHSNNLNQDNGELELPADLSEFTEEYVESLNEDELYKLKDALVKDIARLDVNQYALKLAINSLYGCLTSKQIEIGDDRLGNSTTVSGQLAINEVNKFVREYVNKNFCQGGLDEEGDEYDGIVQFNDTDSCGISLACLSKRGVEITKDGKVTELGFAIIQNIADAVNKHIQQWAKDYFNTNNPTFDLKLEKIVDYGLYRKKKNYVLNVIYNEGKVNEFTGELETKWHYAGIQLAKAIMPQTLKDLGIPIIKAITIDDNQSRADELLKEAYAKFVNLSPRDKCKVIRVKTLDKYVSECGEGWTTKGMGINPRAAHAYNKLIDECGLTFYEKYKQGDDAQLLPVIANGDYKVDAIIFKDDDYGPWPMLEAANLAIDNSKIFVEPFFSCIESLYKLKGWACPQVHITGGITVDDFMEDFF